jgi:hypothetical protein
MIIFVKDDSPGEEKARIQDLFLSETDFITPKSHVSVKGLGCISLIIDNIYAFVTNLTVYSNITNSSPPIELMNRANYQNIRFATLFMKS